MSAERSDEPGPLLGARRGWSLRQRFFATDSYGLLLLLILATLVVSALDLSANAVVMPAIRLVLLGATLAFALHTSAAGRRAYLVCGVLAAAAVVATVAVDAASRLGDAVQSLGAFLLVAAVIATIARRFASHPVVTSSTILAAICIYLFVGFAFATVYGFVAAADVAPLFGGSAGDGTNAERIYFSFITLTTTGYGDLVPAADPARMIAVTEALLGQVYLVTVVAVLVGNVGARRRRMAAEPPGSRTD